MNLLPYYNFFPQLLIVNVEHFTVINYIDHSPLMIRLIVSAAFYPMQKNFKLCIVNLLIGICCILLAYLFHYFMSSSSCLHTYFVMIYLLKQKEILRIILFAVRL